MDRKRPSATADEENMLTGWLAWQHQTVDVKCAGLAEIDAHRAPLSTSPSMTIAGLVSHLTAVEQDWLEGSFLGNEEVLESSQGGWDVGDRSLQELLDRYRQQGARSEQILTQHRLDELEAYAPPGFERVSLRWILTHLIEETGRQLGHLDVLREVADGLRGQ